MAAYWLSQELSVVLLTVEKRVAGPGAPLGVVVVDEGGGLDRNRSVVEEVAGLGQEGVEGDGGLRREGGKTEEQNQQSQATPHDGHLSAPSARASSLNFIRRLVFWLPAEIYFSTFSRVSAEWHAGISEPITAARPRGICTRFR
jgi:hypothetical protein